MPDENVSPLLSLDDELIYTSGMETGQKSEKRDYVGSLYSRYSLRLFKSLRKFLANPDDLEDVVQDTFVRVNDLAYPQNNELPFTYLYRIAVNLIRDKGRAHKIRDQYQKSAVADEERGIDYLSPEHHAMARQRLARMKLELEKLPPRMKEVFILHKVHHKSHKQIADELGVSLSAVEKNIMRVSARFRSAFENEE